MKFSDKSPELFDFVVESNHRLSFTRKALIGLGTVCLIGLAYLPMEQEAETSPVPDTQLTETTITYNSGKTTVLSIESTTIEKTASSTVLSTETSTTVTIDTTTTTEQVREPLPWETHVYQDNGCDEGDTLKVFVQGQDGKAVTAQVSADYMIGSQKVGEQGEPIEPLKGYSKYYVINPDIAPEGSLDGNKEVCFENVPHGASVYIEVYKLDRTESSNPHRIMQSTEQWYGHTMSHQVWPGPGQAVYMRLPKVCRPDVGITAQSGSIHVKPHIGSEPLLPHRLATWGNGPGNYGFAAEDRQFNDSDKEDTLKGLISGQTYLLQVQASTQTGLEHAVRVENVPVDSCQSTIVDVDINPSVRACVAHVGDKVLKCTLLNELIG